MRVLSSVIELKDDPDPDSWKQEYMWKNDSTLYESECYLKRCFRTLPKHYFLW
ncbi:MAG: hypothetical protein P8I55_09390 [Crocinitomix sp.]|nr:hypothetical protein [Crocinitomix sp.]